MILSPMIVEIWLSLAIAGMLILDFMLPHEKKSWFGRLAFAAMVPVLLISARPPLTHSGAYLSGMYLVDSFSLFFKGFFALTTMYVILMTREFERNLERGIPELYILILTATFGMCTLASAGDFLMLFIALETITLSFYVMTTYLRHDLKSIEAGMKYLILGSISTGFLLYGISFLYGATGSTNFASLRQVIAQQPGLSSLLILGFLLVLAGVAFKVAAVPFHFWVPDVYEGAPTPVTAFLSVGSKAAGFVILLRLLHSIFQPAYQSWAMLLATLAGVTILFANLVAIPQKNVKRLMGYSSIGHAGYLLIGIASGTGLGASAVVYYLTGYLFTNLCAFLVIITVYNAIGSDEMEDYAGLSQRSPILAAAMFIALLSLAGVPPLAGFVGKFLLLMSAVHRGMIGLAAIGAGAVVVSLYYYLLLVKTMYAEAPLSNTPIPVRLPIKTALYISMTAILILGIYQGPFLNLAIEAVRPLFG